MRHKTLRMKTIIISLVAIYCFTSCNRQKNKTYAILERVDSLCLAEDYKMVDSLLAGIKTRDLQCDGDKALYYLLKTQTDIALSHQVPSDSLISFSQEYYERTGDNKKLARTYYYRGAYYYTVNRVEDAIMFIKKAEYIDKKHETPWLRSLIYGNLSFLNSISGANQTALEYAQKALTYAIKHDNASWRCFAYNCIASSYEGMKMMDSVYVYTKK